MCCSVSPGVPVHFSGTVLYGAEVAVDGAVVHVLGYQNKVQNGAGLKSVWSMASRFLPTWGPGNAMILPFPAVPRSMTEANVLETKNCRNILKDIAQAVVPPRLTRAPVGRAAAGAPPPKVQVFRAAGIYTVVLAQDARDIPAALDQVPRSKRPALNPALFDAYAKWYPEWTVALCCFNNRRARLANPMLWWYQPMQADRLFLPALDCHTGGVPDLTATVQLDHVVAVGSHRMKRRGQSVDYSDAIPKGVKPYLHEYVIGRQYNHSMRNGDFVCPLTDVWEGRFEPVRSRPPAA